MFLAWQTWKINHNNAVENGTHFMRTKIEINGVKKVEEDLMREEVDFWISNIVKKEI